MTRGRDPEHCCSWSLQLIDHYGSVQTCAAATARTSLISLLTPTSSEFSRRSRLC
jgi:hypothetical protein